MDLIIKTYKQVDEDKIMETRSMKILEIDSVCLKDML